ncbi:MAG: hypothetical protein H7Y18_13375 [Clostridiaceae bacterium]|nr:hypothetical protein [Clostridiaceae bacterium]
MKQEKKNIYIFLDTIFAHIIPLRSFISESEAVEFY